MRQVARTALPPLVVFVVFLAAWELAVVSLDLPGYLLPAPSAVAAEVRGSAPELAAATLQTALAALGGFGLSLLAGGLVAFAFSQSSWIRRSFYPYAIFLQTVPVIAIAPLIVIWLGTGIQSVIVASTIISVFPIITNGTTGLTRLDPGHRELFAMHNASRWDVLVKLRLPASVPYFVTGAKVSSGLSVIGAIVGEFFAGSTERFGLGYVIIVTSGQLRTARLFAAVLASTLLGLLLFAVVSGAGDAMLRRWRARETEG
ncbi:MAG: ABC transporter permease [Sandaracinaceae bacterium]